MDHPQLDEHTKAIKQTVKLFPQQPGIYKFYNDKKELIYVGKAKNIKKRVLSYFQAWDSKSKKVNKVVSKIRNITYVLTNTEYDALLLENSIIKQEQPRYNISLKDGKTFPYLCILNERFPRIIITRKRVPKYGNYYGPYINVVLMKEVLNLINKLYHIRTCSLSLLEKNIEQKKFKVCLEYHIGNCKGPCENLQTEKDYNKEIDMASNILKGKLSIVTEHFKKKMNEAATDLNFEQAAQYKEKLSFLKQFRMKSVVVSTKITDTTVATITSSNQKAFVNYMEIKEGAIVSSENIEIDKKIDESDSDILSHTFHYIQRKRERSDNIVYSNVPITVYEKMKNKVPLKGEKEKIVRLSLKNAHHIKQNRDFKRANSLTNDKKTPLHILQKELGLSSSPQIIECFDNSNIQGSFAVASMVQFVNGRPYKANYRRYNIKTVQGANDFASMAEVIERRYHRILREDGKFPQLIIVDGGKGQLSSAYTVLKKLGISQKISIIGIAKRLEEIYQPNDSIPLHLNRRSSGLLLVQRIRNEAHRFAIAFHRSKRSKKALHSTMTSIPSIGEKTTIKLLQKFKSWEKAKKATYESLKEIVGTKKAKLIKSK